MATSSAFITRIRLRRTHAPSERDVRTMRGWCAAFGKPLLCVIACGAQAQATLFADDEDAGLMLPIRSASQAASSSRWRK